jgi:hypothetical protein
MLFTITSALWNDGRGRLLSEAYPKLTGFAFVNLLKRDGGIGRIDINSIDELMKVIDATGKPLIVGKDEDGPYIQIYDDYIE